VRGGNGRLADFLKSQYQDTLTLLRGLQNVQTAHEHQAPEHLAEFLNKQKNSDFFQNF
jgi:hypothetical protein